MAYEFKKLSDVASVETPADTANVLIEEGGVIKKVANFAQSIINKITRANVVEELSDESYVLIEEGGSVKRAPKTAIGGVSEDVPLYKVIVVNTADNTVISVSPGTYEALQNMMNGNRRPTFVNLVKYHEEYGSTAEIFTNFMKDGDCYWNYTTSSSYVLKIYPNDVVEYYYDD